MYWKLGMFLVAALLFLLSRPRSTASDEPDFQLVYGHVLAQKLSLSHSTPPSDVSEAAQIARKVVQAKTGALSEVQNFSKSPRPTLFSDTLDSRVDTQSVSGGNVFLKESYCSDICYHGGTQCPVCVEQVAALEATTCAFHSTKCPERQLHGDRCEQTARWSLTNEEYCRHCNHTWCHRGSFPGTQSLKIATYNMWNLNSLEWESYSERLGRLGKMLREQDLDILAVQEVRFESGDHTHNQIGELAAFLPGYQYVFQPAMLYMERIDTRTEEGLVIFSRHPILSSDYIFFYRNESDEEDSHQRICLHVEILTPTLQKVHVFVTHLSLSPPSQERSAVELWKFMSGFSGYKVLLGDLNAEPDSPAIRFLRGEEALEGVLTDGMRDTWLEARHKSDFHGLTFSALTSQPTKRIDYIFHQPPPSSDIRVTSTTIMDDQEHCFLPCSDHYGVVATIGWPPQT